VGQGETWLEKGGVGAKDSLLVGGGERFGTFRRDPLSPKKLADIKENNMFPLKHADNTPERDAGVSFGPSELWEESELD